MIKTNQCNFNNVCLATAEWNRIFSIPIFFIISTKLVTASCIMFSFIQGLILPNVFLNTMRWSMLSNLFMDLFTMFTVFTAVDIPVQEVSYKSSNVFIIGHSPLYCYERMRVHCQLTIPVIPFNSYSQAIFFPSFLRDFTFRLMYGNDVDLTMIRTMVEARS